MSDHFDGEMDVELRLALLCLDGNAEVKEQFGLVLGLE